ncbi:MAG: KamA family radical SAM protein, partial [Coriobacteriia bacterium]|nr:KamA family radical SAM protein [Coriobacteriia bacterium]
MVPHTVESTGRIGEGSRRPARYLTDVRALARLGGVDPAPLARVCRHYAFRTNDYYARLIDWSAEQDPIRTLIVPSEGELSPWGRLDASNEASNTKLPGLQHKYADTALMLVTDQCAGFCRYCFRKRLFRTGNRETAHDVSGSIDYIRAHPEITDVLLTGGDPLTLPTHRLAPILHSVASIPHVTSVRIGSKILAFNPYRVLDDAELQRMFGEYAGARVRIHLMCHFDHPRELTEEAVAAVRLLHGLGVMLVNQCPVTAGVNDDPQVLAELFR